MDPGDESISQKSIGTNILYTCYWEHLLSNGVQIYTDITGLSAPSFIKVPVNSSFYIIFFAQIISLAAIGYNNTQLLGILQPNAFLKE